MVDQEGDEEPFGHARSWLNGNWVEARDLVVDERVLSVLDDLSFKSISP